jgi:hypothetical protein
MVLNALLADHSRVSPWGVALSTNQKRLTCKQKRVDYAICRPLERFIFHIRSLAPRILNTVSAHSAPYGRPSPREDHRRPKDTHCRGLYTESAPRGTIYPQ